MIIAWVLSLLLLMASLIAYLQRTTALELVAIQTIQNSQSNIIKAENALLECESGITQLAALPANQCNVQSLGQQVWKISTTGETRLESVIFLEDSSTIPIRLSWRQAFKE